MKLSMSRVNGDVRGDSPTTHLDLLIQIFSERLIIPMTIVRADPVTLTLHVLTIFVSDVLSGADSDDQCPHWKCAQIGFMTHVEKYDCRR
nr:MAG TPA: hypothetical protein [Caudoviricetes sp.]